ncbi:hypothetical protein KP509_23G044100 [Ceratopteris richardii]|uniref:AB hydrolase-1 domain-containing protein n=1 Tax=Ceratopteris richardii TaxID=49495 RepID=A0A8T2S1U1_CERRI|nr:hypothetical protein KP509_23G044100 [Ceratopteris richardii]
MVINKVLLDRGGKVTLLVLVAFLAWFYKAIHPPPPILCGTPHGPPVTAPRVQLKDGRYLAYKEIGTEKEKAAYKIINIHGFRGSRHDIPLIPKATMEELHIYYVGFDRAGYGQSDPNPGRSLKSDAQDVVELADILQLGPRFYVTATSIGGSVAWTLLKHFPHRLAGVGMLGPVTNYWWSGIPTVEAWEAFRFQPIQDQVAVSVAHYAPWLAYLWNTQNVFPKSSVVAGRFDFWSMADKKIIASFQPSNERSADEPTQQGIHESLIRDMVNMFGRWDFDPGDLINNGVPVHIWHGDEDSLVPLMLQKYVQRRLSWIHLHVVPGAGHLLHVMETLSDEMARTLLSGQA